MSEALSTFTIPLRWAAKEKRKDELLQTSFFLFRENEGHVVVREHADDQQAAYEGKTGSAERIEATGKSSVPSKIARIPQTKIIRSHPEQRYILLKKYEGFVTSRCGDSFSARLFENSSDYPVVEAEFDLEELSETDRGLAVEGAPLVWTIGYAYDGSTRKRESVIYLRRLPAWNDTELDQGRKAAEDLTRAIPWE